MTRTIEFGDVKIGQQFLWGDRRWTKESDQEFDEHTKVDLIEDLAQRHVLPIGVRAWLWIMLAADAVVALTTVGTLQAASAVAFFLLILVVVIEKKADERLKALIN